MSLICILFFFASLSVFFLSLLLPFNLNSIICLLLESFLTPFLGELILSDKILF